MERKVNTNIPVIFQNLKQYEKEDERFIKIKIWLMHTGVNLNGSSFSKEAVESAIPSLANTPILSFIEENSVGEQDFSDHRMVLHRSENGDLSIKYLGQAVGVIPENNNAHWEKRVADKGEELEYLVVEGLMWTKWDDPIDIMNRKKTTAQSMELAENYTGFFDKDGIFHFETFKFFGACLLGDDVSPAMVNSTVELQFSNQDMQNTIENKLQEFNTLFSNKGGTSVEDVKQEFEEVTETTETEVVDTIEGQVDEVTEETFEQVEETVENVDETTETVEVQEDFEVKKVEEKEETTTDFALTHNQIESQLRQALSTEKYIDRWGDSCRKYWYVDRTDSQVIVENTQEGYQLYSFDYVINGDNVTINFETGKKVKIEYVPFEGESIAFTSNIERFESEKSSITSELELLKSYKRQREEQDLTSKFADKLSEEEIKEVFDSSKDFSLDLIEEKLLAKFGKKNFSLVEEKTNKPVVEINFNKQDESKEENPYGNFFE